MSILGLLRCPIRNPFCFVFVAQHHSRDLTLAAYASFFFSSLIRMTRRRCHQGKRNRKRKIEVGRKLGEGKLELPYLVWHLLFLCSYQPAHPAFRHGLCKKKKKDKLYKGHWT